MSPYVTGTTIRTLRSRAKLTQEELAARIGVTAKAVSRWETGRGLPDATLLEPLAKALRVSVSELLTGAVVENANRAGNARRARVYACPACGNLITALGEASISCCGIALPPLETDEADAEHTFACERSDGELFVSGEHPMTKSHFITAFILATESTIDLRKLYPEQSCEARFPLVRTGTLLALCNRDGLFRIPLPAPKRASNAPEWL